MGKGEGFLTTNNIDAAVLYYKEALTEIDQLLSTLKKNKTVSIELIDSIECLRVNLSKSIFDYSSLSKQQKSSPTPLLPDMRTLLNNSIYPNIQNQESCQIDLDDDPALNMIMNKLQTNVVKSLKESEISKGEIQNPNSKLYIELNYHMEQFKKELVWYEKKKFQQYDNDMASLLKKNTKLQHQVDKLKDRWDNLVESARQRRES